MDLQLRAGKPSDHALVLDSMINTLRSSPHSQGASNTVLASLVEPLLHSPNWALTIAHPANDEDTILGFIIFEVSARAPAIAWVQVRAPFRRHGIGRALVHHALGAKLPRELHTAFMVQSIGQGAPPITDIARRMGITLRFRPYLPLQASLDNASHS